MHEWLGGLHRLMAAPLMGLLPPGYPPDGPGVRCSAALAFLCLAIGWLLPAYLALRSHCGAPRDGRGTQRPHRLWPAPQAAPLCGSSDDGGSSSSDVDGGSGEPAGSGGSQRHSLAHWVLENVFLAAAPEQMRVQAWCSLVSFCWLAATLFAVLQARDT